MTAGQPWPWSQTMDALLAAPASHRVLLENDRVRVLEVVIEPGAREPEHTHQAASEMIVDEPARSHLRVTGTVAQAGPRRLAGRDARRTGRGRTGAAAGGMAAGWLAPAA